MVQVVIKDSSWFESPFWEPSLLKQSETSPLSSFHSLRCLRSLFRVHRPVSLHQPSEWECHVPGTTLCHNVVSRPKSCRPMRYLFWYRVFRPVGQFSPTLPVSKTSLTRSQKVLVFPWWQGYCLVMTHTTTWGLWLFAESSPFPVISFPPSYGFENPFDLWSLFGESVSPVWVGVGGFRDVYRCFR